MTQEDATVIGKVLAALGELGITLLLQNLVPVMWDYGPHRLYQWEAITRDDEPFNDTVFKKKLAAINRMMKHYKPQVYSVETYPAEESMFSRTYLTIYI